MNNEYLFELFGLGLWHSGDEHELAFMLMPANNAENTPHRLVPLDRSEYHNVDRVKLFNLAQDDLSEDVGTTRVIRVYEQKRGKIEIRNRLDWELRISQQVKNRLAKTIPTAIDRIKEIRDVDAIVIKDLEKGVVTNALIKSLTERAPTARWYVSSKAWHPPWYDLLPKDDVRLILVPQAAAQKAVREGHISSSTWITVGGTGSKEALNSVDRISMEFPKAHIVVLPNGMQVLARDPKFEAPPKGYRQPEVGHQSSIGLVPMASVLFAAIVSKMECQLGKPFNQILDTSINYTVNWMKHEYNRFTIDDWIPDNRQDLNASQTYSHKVFNSHEFGWENANRHWKESREALGVVRYQQVGASKLQLWRAMTEVDGYLACVPSKRDVAKRLVEQCRLFLREHSRHMAYMVIDAPGTGKSYLVDCLARQLGLRFLKFNVTQMLNREDLMQCFDKIATSQSDAHDESMLVFVDEINATLDSQHVYDAFLAPLEDGIYVRAGNTFHIAPCFWVFAGTRRPEGHAENDPPHSNKGSDFVSRLTVPPLDLSVNLDNHIEVEMARLEKIYIGGAAIRHHFPDVRRVTRKVLNAIDILPPRFVPRDIAQFVKRFRDVQYGMVTSLNLPQDWEKEFAVQANEFDIWRGDFDSNEPSDRVIKEEEDIVFLESSPHDDFRQEFGHPEAYS